MSVPQVREVAPGGNAVAWFGRVAGPLCCVAWLTIPNSWTGGMSAQAQTTAAIANLIAVWWVTEAYPLAAVSLLPLLLFPLTGVLKLDQAAAKYGDKYVFLFMAGFMISRALEHWNLHRRLALLTVLAVGTSPVRLVGGIILATGAVSMWISNTATAAMMLPLGMSLVVLVREELRKANAGVETEVGAVPSVDNFATCMMLGIAYAASIGGLGTLVGTPTNMLLPQFAAKHGLYVGFAQWFWFAMPLSLTFLFLVWLVLTQISFPIRLRTLPGGRELIRAELRSMGPVSRGEWTVLAVFFCTALAWVCREPLAKWEWLVSNVPAIQRLDDSLIGIAGAIALFLIPVNLRKGIFALDWPTASTIPWGILLLFGGGFCLAEAIERSELSQWIGSRVMYFQGSSPFVLVLISTTLVVFMTELTSNTPTAAALLPVLYSVARGMNMDPLLLLIPATLAASCGFMLPVGTPPNALAFGSGYIKMGQMLKAGVVLNLIGIVLIPVWVYVFGPWALGIRIH